MGKQKRQFGTWSSPVSARMLSAALNLNDVLWDTGSDTLIWLEGRGGQGVLVAQTGASAPRDLTSELSVRARVGYGGGDFTVASGNVYFAGPEGRLYRQMLAQGDARPITPGFGAAASPRVSADGLWLIFVHTYEDVDCLALVDADGKLWPRKLAEGFDFFMQPVWHPQGSKVAYVAWDQPNMPWDGTQLFLASLEMDAAGIPVISAKRCIAGDNNTSVFQPEFSPDGRFLSYVSDVTGFWQLYLYDLESEMHQQVTEDESEHGRPGWVQGIRMYGWTPDSRAIYFLRNAEACFGLWRYDLGSKTAHRVSALDHYSSMAQIAVSARHDMVALIASSPVTPPRIISYTAEGGEWQMQLYADSPSIKVIVEEGDLPPGEFIHRRAGQENIPPAQLASPQHITWSEQNGEIAHGLYYAPTSDRFEGVGLPPLIVSIHGGPTSQSDMSYAAEAQFFATRGFAVLQVNHRGSTGYGREYMLRLRDQWGVVDVEDGASGASYLAGQGLADSAKFVIMGRSAGGYTVLQSLTQKPGFYRAGVCAYGIANHFLLVQDTHKFEARYQDSLMGALPDAAAVYRERSPYFHAARITDPVIVFQGADDVVVPKNQSDAIVSSLRARGVAHEYHVYEGEGHGFRKPENIEHYYTSILRFLMQYVIYA